MRLEGINHTEGEADVDQDLIAQRRVRYEIQVSLAGDAAELDVTDAALTLILDPHDLTGHGKAHIQLLNSIIPQCRVFR